MIKARCLSAQRAAGCGGHARRGRGRCGQAFDPALDRLAHPAGRSVSGQWWHSTVAIVACGRRRACARIASGDAKVAPVDSSTSAGCAIDSSRGSGANISATSCR